MTEILKFTGAALALLAALLFSREYEKYLFSKNELALGFLSLLKHIQKSVGCYLATPKELLCGFEDSALDAAGYLAAAREKDVFSAYFDGEKNFSLSERARLVLSEFFANFGREYKDGTMRLVERAIAELEKITSEEKAKTEKEIKVLKTLAAAAALGLVILLI